MVRQHRERFSKCHFTKRRYGTQEAAERQAQQDQAAFGTPMRAYLCRCKWWHLTSQPLQIEATGRKTIRKVKASLGVKEHQTHDG